MIYFKHIFKIAAFLLCLLMFQNTNAQPHEIKLDETLKYINEKLGKKFLVETRPQQGFFVKFFDDNGKLIRDDYVKHIRELNLNNVFYDENEKTLTVPCKEDFKGCVDRHLYVNKFHREYSRINFILNVDEKTAKGLTKAFTHLLALLSNPEYKSSEPFE